MELEVMRQIVEDVAVERVRMIAVIAKMASTPPPMDTAKKLHVQLTRAFAALHAIASNQCASRPDEAAYEIESRGYRKACKAPDCLPCAAFRALVVEGQLPF